MKTLAEIRIFLKTHYLRARSHDSAQEILYGRKATPENRYKTIFLDLGGYPEITKDEIKDTISVLKFEDVLQCVDIPKITAEVITPGVADSKAPKKQPNKNVEGRRDLVEVFRWLSGVETILKLTVDDLVHPAHSDRAIEEALKNKVVEIWDWKKLDICSELIRVAAPNVREVNLYWSGNNAVLRGWSEKEGLPQLKNLEKIELHIRQGLEPKPRLNLNISKFTERLKWHFMKRRARDLATEMIRDISSEVERILGREKDTQ